MYMLYCAKVTEKKDLLSLLKYHIQNSVLSGNNNKNIQLQFFSVCYAQEGYFQNFAAFQQVWISNFCFVSQWYE